MSYLDNFIGTLVKHSVSNEWTNAKYEWEHIDTYEESGRECVCGKTDITDICVIKNRETGEILEVGNHCVKKIGVEVDDEFRWIKGKSKSAPKSILKRARANEIINEREYLFYLNIHRKRKLSVKQELYKKSIEEKLNNMKKTRGIPDKQIFKDMTTFKHEHKQILLKHLKNVMLKINNDELTVEQAATTLDGIAESVFKLKRSYNND